MTSDSGTVRPLVPERVDDLPPSSKLVYLVLDQLGEATIDDVQSAVALPESTTKLALGKLRREDVVEARPDPSHPQCHRYSICTACDDS